jgi:hypothetical protein
MPSTPARAATAAPIEPAARRMSSAGQVISVGSSPVVPSRRCAAAMCRAASASGVSLNSTPPPPFTCTSI